MTLAKVIPRAYAAGFNNDDFWGHAVYMALRFPAGLHPFTTPIVREMIARLRFFSITGEDTWSAGPEGTINVKLAATWAGYHISRHLIERNAYHVSDAEVQRQYQKLDNFIWLVATKHKLIRALFEDVVKSNVLFGTSADKLHDEVAQAQWDRFAGTCHILDYSQPCALPLPLRKPSIILKEMQVEQPRSEGRPWDETRPFITKYDAPFEMAPSRVIGEDVVLSDKLGKLITDVNKQLADFLISHQEEPDLDNGNRSAATVTLADARALFEQVEAVRFRSEDLGLDIAAVKECVDHIKEHIPLSQQETKQSQEAFKEEILAECKSMIQQATDDIKAEIVRRNKDMTEAVVSLLERFDSLTAEAKHISKKRVSDDISCSRSSSEHTIQPKLEETTATAMNYFVPNKRKLIENPLASQRQMGHSPRPASFPALDSVERPARRAPSDEDDASGNVSKRARRSLGRK